MQKYKHIVWDWNGTLLNDAKTCVSILNEILSRRGMAKITFEQYREKFDFPVKDYYRRIGFDFSVEPFEIVANEYIEAYRHRQFECRLQKGAEKILKEFVQKGLKQSILSAYYQEMLEEVVKFFGIRELFFRVIGLNDYYASSKVESGKVLLKELKLKPGDVVLIGDTVHDFEVASEIGVDCILIADGHNQREKLESCGVTVLDSIEQVTKWCG